MRILKIRKCDAQQTGAKVIWVDRNYKTHSKTFNDDPKGPVENGTARAKKYAEKLNKQCAASGAGMYRSVEVETF